MLSWSNEGKYQAELRKIPNTEDYMVVIHTDNEGGGELTIFISLCGTVALKVGIRINTDIRLSINAPLNLTFKQYSELQKVISEARDVLRKLKRRGRVLHMGCGDNTACGLCIDTKTLIGTEKTFTCTNCKRMLERKARQNAEMATTN